MALHSNDNSLTQMDVGSNQPDTLTADIELNMKLLQLLEDDFNTNNHTPDPYTPTAPSTSPNNPTTPTHEGPPSTSTCNCSSTIRQHKYHHNFHKTPIPVDYNILRAFYHARDPLADIRTCRAFLAEHTRGPSGALGAVKFPSLNSVHFYIEIYEHVKETGCWQCLAFGFSVNDNLQRRWAKAKVQGKLKGRKKAAGGLVRQIYKKGKRWRVGKQRQERRVRRKVLELTETGTETVREGEQEAGNDGKSVEELDEEITAGLLELEERDGEKETSRTSKAKIEKEAKKAALEVEKKLYLLQHRPKETGQSARQVSDEYAVAFKRWDLGMQKTLPGYRHDRTRRKWYMGMCDGPEEAPSSEKCGHEGDGNTAQETDKSCGVM